MILFCRSIEIKLQKCSKTSLCITAQIARMYNLKE